MDFGNVAAGATPGSVVLTPAGTRLRTGGVALPSVTGTVTAASFVITGAPNFAYSITLPNDPLTLTNGIDNMTIGLFASNPPTTGMLGNNGSQTLNVGATLNVAALQGVGDYTSVNPFEVTVNYN